MGCCNYGYQLLSERPERRCSWCFWIVNILLIILLLVSVSRLLIIYEDNTICCDEAIGCFTNTENGLYDHLPKTACPEDLKTVYKMYSRRTGRPLRVNRDYIPPEFNSSLRLIYITHGYGSAGDKEWITQLTNAILKQEDAQIVTVDWSEAAQHIYYPQAASDMRSVGRELAVINNRFISYGLAQPSNIWCVGHSLGAHMCGIAGKRTHFGRITGLDPAGPNFEGYDIIIGLHPASADLVDVIHTDGGGLANGYGSMRPLGHIDFYPNGGIRQPRCIKNVEYISLSCDHGIVKDYFIESVAKPVKVSMKCTNAYDIKASCGSCEQDCPVMGFHLDFKSQTNESQIYYLKYE